MAETTPDIMQQFNAIRSRLDTVNQDVRPNATQPASDLIMRRDLKDESGNVALSAFSLDKPRSKQEFDRAYDVYQKAGNRVPGFTFLEPGVEQKLRSGFEAANKPIQAASQQLDSPDARINSLPESMQGIAKTILRAPAEQMRTPEGAGALAGTMALAPWAKGLHVLKQAATVGLGAGAGSLTADIATGSNQGNPERRVSNALQQTTLAAVSQGIVGGFKQAIGQGFSQKAKQQVAGDLMDLLKREAAPLSNNPDGLQIYGSTIPGANKIIQVGIKALRGDIDTVGSRYSANQFVADIAANSPHALKKETAAEVKKLVKRLETQGNKLLDNIDDSETFTATRETMLETKQKIVDTINADFSKSSSAVQGAQYLRTEQVVEQYTKQLDGFVDVAEVLSYMKQSVGPNGFDPTMMQKLVQYKAGQNPGSLLDRASNAVFRGADDRLAGTDAPLTLGIPMSSIPGINKIPGLKNMTLGTKIGDSYVGKVRGTYPRTEAGASLITIDSIKKFMEEK